MPPSVSTRSSNGSLVPSHSKPGGQNKPCETTNELPLNPVVRVAGTRKPNFTEESDRLRSFGTWPQNAPISKEKVARAGFYYLGSGFEVACPYCKIEICDWTFDDVALKKHRDRSPICPFVLKTSTTKIPLEDLMKDPTKRLETFRHWPNTRVEPQRLVNAGFYYLNEGDKVRCAWCKGVIQEWNSNDSPFDVHSQLFPCCSFVLNPPNSVCQGEDECGPRSMSSTSGVQSPSNTETGIILHKAAKHPTMNAPASRLKTFESENWPANVQVKPEELSEAGFFYLGMHDYTKCFHCDGGLCNWEKGDRPWVEHARWFPQCIFVKLNKGEGFIQECKRMHQKLLSEASSIAEEQSSSSDLNIPSHLQSELEAIMQSADVKYFLEIGVPTEIIRMTLKKFMMDNQRGFRSHDEMSIVLGQVLSFKKSAACEEAPTPKKASEIPENVLCRVCMDNERGVVFVPCGHFVTCPSCALGVTDCVICRKKITGTVRTFIA